MAGLSEGGDCIRRAENALNWQQTPPEPHQAKPPSQTQSADAQIRSAHYNFTMTTTDKFRRQREHHARLIESGHVRMPGGFLTPDAAQALERLTASGMSKSEAINAALIEYSLLNQRGNK